LKNLHSQNKSTERDFDVSGRKKERENYHSVRVSSKISQYKYTSPEKTQQPMPYSPGLFVSSLNMYGPTRPTKMNVNPASTFGRAKNFSTKNIPNLPGITSASKNIPVAVSLRD
jgi:hypothetical protein